MDKDRLSDLPINDNVQMNEQEADVMGRYFDGGKESTSGRGWKSNAKIISIASVSFLVVANPWTDKLISNLYDFGNDFIVVLVKTVLFALIFTVLFMMLV
ncbi:hypothetical protein OAG24_01245 [bacterium]|nr:hypothetical protein [bacterium]